MERNKYWKIDISDQTDIVRILYNHYMENDASDEGEIQKGCEELDRLLQELTINDHDRIWDVAMALCGLHERRGFEAGFRMGVKLARELGEPGRGETVDFCTDKRKFCQNIF